MPITDDVKLKFSIILILTFSFQLVCQETIYRIVPQKGRFENLESALKSDPDSVSMVFLGNSNLKEFPTELFRFKNLVDISFYDFNIIEILQFDTLQLTLKDKILARKIIKKRKLGERLPDFTIPSFPVRNRNKIKHIPDDIITLKKLSSISFSKHQISRKQKKKLQRLLPNCDIEVD